MYHLVQVKRVVSSVLLHITDPNKVRLLDIWTVFQVHPCILYPANSSSTISTILKQGNLCSGSACEVTVLGMEGIVRCTAVWIGNPTQTSAQQAIGSTAQNMPPLTYATKRHTGVILPEPGVELNDFRYPACGIHFPNYTAVGN
jgi:hypothetical protein